MQTTIDWPYKEGILATTKICCVHVHTPSTPTFIGQNAHIILVYDDGEPVVQARHTPVLDGSDCFHGVTISDKAHAIFRVKINVLSSQHENAQFKFQVSVDDKTCTTESFKTLSKVTRTKEKRKRSSESDDEASTTSATGTAADTPSDCDDYNLSDIELGALLDGMIPSENMSISDIRNMLHDVNLHFINMSHKMQMVMKSLQNLRD
jgi:hypothetical protein